MTDTYDAVLFDMDGVILRRGSGGWQPLVEEAAATALEQHGVPEDDPRYEPFRNALCDGDVAALAEHGETYGVEPETLWQTRKAADVKVQRRQLYEDNDRDLHNDISALSTLQDHYDLGLVSNNCDGFVQYVTRTDTLLNGQLPYDSLDPLFDVSQGIPHTLDARDRRKPDSHYLETAVDDLDAAKAAYVGDKEVDILAAQRADMDAVFVPHDRDEDTLSEKLATFDAAPTYAFEDLEEMTASLIP